ncbi:MAG: hypothetical protein GY795_14645 [Desulfobacterales bacterium]|nr:hypothetical protein [Desulfobacterales bacterium]
MIFMIAMIDGDYPDHPVNPVNHGSDSKKMSHFLKKGSIKQLKLSTYKQQKEEKKWLRNG